MTNNDKSPAIRFKGFTDDWEQRKLIDMLVQSITDGPHETPQLIEDGIPFISVDAIEDNRIDFTRKRGCISEEYDNLCSKKYKPQFHDVYLVKSGSTVGKVAIVETTERFNIWSPLAAMRCGDKSDANFLYYLLQTKDIQDQVFDKASHGTQPNLSMRQLENFDICIPINTEEQQQIGAYFRNLDTLITLHQRKCDKLIQFKAAMLQKMFPQNGANKPEIRFKGFTDAWEQRKLGDLIEDNVILEQSDGNHGELYPRNEEFVESGIPYISAANITSDGEYIDFNETKYLPYDRAKKFRKGVTRNGDVLLAHNATVGPCLRLSMDFEYAILSTSLTLFRIDDRKMNPDYFLQMLRSEQFQSQLTKLMKQTTRNQVPILTQRIIECCYPINAQEQKAIGTYFKNLDTLITLHQRKCDKYKIIKAGLIRKLFP